ncbi:MAG: periplasmic heavy metal sensor, partial [Deltaproteobacteria bacterium]|nr:periplasmic heavy metal sensor [Deltaproteobacteria bacterium]
TIKLKGRLYLKKRELHALLAAPQVDEAKANALHTEITKLHDELAQKRFAAMLDFKKKNPDWQPRLGHGGLMGGSMGGGGMGMGCR